MIACTACYFCIQSQRSEERIPLLRLFNNRHRARPASPIPLNDLGIHGGNGNPGSDPTPQSIDSSPRSEAEAGPDEADARRTLRNPLLGLSMEVDKYRNKYISTKSLFIFLIE